MAHRYVQQAAELGSVTEIDSSAGELAARTLVHLMISVMPLRLEGGLLSRRSPKSLEASLQVVGNRLCSGKGRVSRGPLAAPHQRLEVVDPLLGVFASAAQPSSLLLRPVFDRIDESFAHAAMSSRTVSRVQTEVPIPYRPPMLLVVKCFGPGMVLLPAYSRQRVTGCNRTPIR
jgi:hypothetical protein